MFGFGADPVCGVTDDICRQAPWVAFCRSTKTGQPVLSYVYQARYNELSQITDKRLRHCEACRLAGGKITCERASQCETLMMTPKPCPLFAPTPVSVMMPTKITAMPGAQLQPFAPALPGGMPTPVTPGLKPITPGFLPGLAPPPEMQTMPGELPPELQQALAPTEAEGAPALPRPGEEVVAPAAAKKNWIVIVALGAAVLGAGYLLMRKEKRT